MNDLACGDESLKCADSNTEAKQWGTMNPPVLRWMYSMFPTGSAVIEGGVRHIFPHTSAAALLIFSQQFSLFLTHQ